MYILKVPENTNGAFREIQDGRQDGHSILMTIDRRSSWIRKNINQYCLGVV